MTSGERSNRRRGLTLVEIMVAIGLIAVSLMMVLALIPAGIHSAQRAENVQSAAAWSRRLGHNRGLAVQQRQGEDSPMRRR